jgi:iron complex transport system ATP-binding protein
MRSILSIKNLSLRRDDVQILNHIDWEIKSGQHWVILGTNGSGKTCLLHCLTGYITPTSGTLTVLDQTYEEDDWRELRKDIGIVSSGIRQMISDEELGMDIVASGKEAMLNHWEDWSPAIQKKTRSILKQVECEHLAERPWLYLSQGERQRILIGRSMMTDSRILILDEPCAGLDPVARENFLIFLYRLAKQKENLTFIFVTHHIEEISPFFTHSLILKGGEILSKGKIGECFTDKILSEAFHSKVKISKTNNRYCLRISPNKK